MDGLAAHLPEIIAAAAQSYLGILALLSVALSVLAYFFFASASEKVKVGIFVMLFLGVVGFSVAMFRSAASAQAEQPGQGSVGSTLPAATQSALSEDAEALLSEAVSDPAGVVMLVHYGMGTDLETNGKNLISDQTRRTVARWEAALKELVEGELLVERGTQGEVFEVTQKGYDFVERLAASKG